MENSPENIEKIRKALSCLPDGEAHKISDTDLDQYRVVRVSGEITVDLEDGHNKNQEWITENFEALVSEYGGKYVGVVNEHVIAAALTPKAVLELAKMKGQDEEDVSLLKVPTEEELVCVL